MTVVTPITTTERARRREQVDAARASAALEGQQVTDQTHADQEAYVDGRLNLAELGRRVRAHHGAG